MSAAVLSALAHLKELGNLYFKLFMQESEFISFYRGDNEEWENKFYWERYLKYRSYCRRYARACNDVRVFFFNKI